MRVYVTLYHAGYDRSGSSAGPRCGESHVTVHTSTALQASAQRNVYSSQNMFYQCSYTGVCVCLYVICMYVCLYTCLSIYISVCLYDCMSVCLYVCMSVCLSICISVYLYICMSAFLSVCLSVCLSVSMCVCVCVCVCVWVFSPRQSNLYITI